MIKGTSSQKGFICKMREIHAEDSVPMSRECTHKVTCIGVPYFAGPIKAGSGKVLSILAEPTVG
jgi:hypothetical protein